MASIVVRGGTPLAGSVRVSGSKNASLPILAACLLNEQPVTLHNVPELHDVGVIGEVLESLGAQCGRNAAGDLRVDAARVSGFEPPYELVNKMRASFLVLGPLLARFGEASVPLPGGCAIGARPVGEHLEAMRVLGAEVTQESGRIVARAKKLIGAEIYLNMVSVGASENAIIAATLADGMTTIGNAAEEPEVVDLCHFLRRCGVEIEGIGTNTVIVHGQPRISAAVDYSVIPDRIEAGTYLLALAATGGSGTVSGLHADHLEALLLKLRDCGLHVEVEDHQISVDNRRPLKPANVRTAVYPGFPTDLQPQMTALLTSVQGMSTVTETIFEKRLSHVPELARMGARIQISGNTAVIEGTPGGLTGVPVEAQDLRCSAALVIAGLMARGETRIDGLQHLLRGYERLPEKLTALGGSVSYAEADITAGGAE